jgi:hypothetical protein
LGDGEKSPPKKSPTNRDQQFDSLSGKSEQELDEERKLYHDEKSQRRCRGQVGLFEENWRGPSEVHIRPESGGPTITLSYSRERGDFPIALGAFITFKCHGNKMTSPQRWKVMSGLVCFIGRSALDSYDEVVDANIQHFESPNTLLLRLPSSEILAGNRKEVARAALESNQRLLDVASSGAEFGLNRDFDHYIASKGSLLADKANPDVLVLSQVGPACPSSGYDCDDVVGMVGYGEVTQQDFGASIRESCVSAAMRLTARESKLVVPLCCVQEGLTLQMESLHQDPPADAPVEQKTAFIHACFISDELAVSFLDGKAAFGP